MEYSKALIFPLVSNSVMEDVLQSVLLGLLGSELELLSGNGAFDTGFRWHHLAERQCTRDLDLQAIKESKFDVYFAPVKRKTIFQDWKEPSLIFTFGGYQLEVFDSSKYRKNVIECDGDSEEEITFWITKARVAFPNWQHIWCRHDIGFLLMESHKLPQSLGFPFTRNRLSPHPALKMLSRFQYPTSYLQNSS